MALFISFLLLFSYGTYAAKINCTLVESCASDFMACNISNCTKFFSNCLDASEIHTVKPASCYQAEAASKSFKIATYVAGGVFFLSLIVFPLLNAGLEIAIQRLSCCASVPFDDVIQFRSSGSMKEKKVDSLGKIFVGKLSSSLNTLITAAISFVTVGWLFAMWKGETLAWASCDYDSNLLEPDYP